MINNNEKQLAKQVDNIKSIQENPAASDNAIFELIKTKWTD